VSDLLVKSGLIYSYIYEGYHAIKLQMADVYVKDGVIAEVGPNVEKDCEKLDAAGCMVLPGMINMGSSTFAARITSGLLCDRRVGRAQIEPMLDLAVETLSEDELYAVALLGLWDTVSGGATTVAEAFGGLTETLAPVMERAAKRLSVRTEKAPDDPGLLVESAISCAHFGIPYKGLERIESGDKLTMGTGCFDSCMISEMRAVACSVKQQTGDAGAYKASDVFYSATVVNGRVLNADKYGRIGAGFVGDLSVVAMERFDPMSYPLAQYVYGANSGDVKHVICGGNIIKRDHKPAEHLKEPLRQAAKVAETAILKLWAEARRRIL